MPADEAIPPAPAPNNSKRPRMSLQKKLWLAGLGFPTLLLIAITAYMIHRAPTIQLINNIERQYAENMSKLTRYSSQRYLPPIATRAPWPWDDQAASTPLPWHHKYFGSIIKLNLNQSQIDANDIESIARIHTLQELSIRNPEIDNEVALRALEHLHDLRSLSIDGSSTPLSDSSMEWIGGLDKLEWLSIGNASDVTDQGLVYLARLSALKYLYLGDVSVSRDSIEALREALPITDIHFSPDYSPYHSER